MIRASGKGEVDEVLGLRGRGDYQGDGEEARGW